MQKILAISMVLCVREILKRSENPANDLIKNLEDRFGF
jgi:hypothetical protein